MEDIEAPHVYTNSDQLSGVTEEYVCWLDLMGIKGAMSRSIETSAIDILNLHVAVDETIDRNEITHYPVMDGVYLTSESKEDMQQLLIGVFSKLAKDNIENRDREYTYIPRGALSYGPIIHGENISDEANESFMTSSDYADTLLIGLPMIQAIESESKAPPFGIFIDQSARAFAPDGEDPIERRWYEWYRYLDDEIEELLYNTLEDYYEWCESNAHRVQYPKEDIKRHRTMAKEYLMR
ncbi:hypothetical protein [Haloarcula marina]|uniref:hypothetical protein n=1 Tax=Haloarcula marina TaxID=2961574 RepID=UPI0020B6BCFD|nr:hypothetical protein [Halomicroarcula marina]